MVEINVEETLKREARDALRSENLLRIVAGAAALTYTAVRSSARDEIYKYDSDSDAERAGLIPQIAYLQSLVAIRTIEQQGGVLPEA